MSIEDNGGDDDFVAVTDQTIRDRIIHVLSVWPQLSPSMLQVGIGTALAPRMWHPIFEKLIADGVIKRETKSGRGPTGRDQTFTVISLVEPPVAKE